MNKNLNPIDILGKIGDLINSKNTSKGIIHVYREAFGEEDNVKLFKLRALLLNELERIFESTNKSQHIQKAFDDIYMALSYPNLSNNMKDIQDKFTSGNIATLELAFTMRDFKQDFEATDEISTLNEELKELLEVEYITETQKIIIKQICYEIDEVVEEYVITGNTAIQKLYDSLVGKLYLYQYELTNIDSHKINETLSKIYTKVDTLNKAMNTLMSIGSKAKDIIDLLPF